MMRRSASTNTSEGLSSPLRWLALLGATIFLAAAAVVAAGSLQFAYDAGAALTEIGTGLISGSWMLMALDAGKIGCIAAFPFFIARRQWLMLLFSVLVFLVGTTFSLYASYRAQVVAYAKADAVESKLKTDEDTLDKDIAELKRRLARPEYANATTEAEVDAEMLKYKINPKFSASGGCQNAPSPPGTVKFCEEWSVLFSKLAAAHEADKIRKDLNEKQAEKKSYEAASTANAEVKTIAEALGVSTSTAYVIRSGGFALGYEIASGLVLSVAIGTLMLALGGVVMRRDGGHVNECEADAAAGTSIIPETGTSNAPTAGTQNDPPPGPKTTPPSGPKSGTKTGTKAGTTAGTKSPEKTGTKDRSHLRVVQSCPETNSHSWDEAKFWVMRFAEEMVPHERKKRHAASDIRAAYEAFCDTHGIEPLGTKKFAPVMTEIGLRNDKIGGKSLYIDHRKPSAANDEANSPEVETA